MVNGRGNIVKRLLVGLAVLGIAGAVIASFASPLTASQERRSFLTRLEGYDEVPAVSTTGRATFHARLSGSTLEFEMSYAGLSAPATAAHIHFGQRDVNGGVSAFLCGGGSKPACPGGTSGSVSGTIVAADVIGPAAQGITAGEFAELVRAMVSGVTYANIHTSTFPGGEIRGQINHPD
jgi:hypothetical protein